MKKHIKEAFETGLLSPISLERGLFSLKGTDFLVNIREDAAIWKKKIVKINGTNYTSCTFESVFKASPKHIQEKMIYHMDILNKQMSYSRKGKGWSIMAHTILTDFGMVGQSHLIATIDKYSNWRK